MRPAQHWKDYELIDATDGKRLERWGEYILIRPDPQVIWHSEKKSKLWNKADAIYHRSSSGGGNWEFRKRLPSEWEISWNGYMKLLVTPTNFKHTGVFPEQAANWEVYNRLIENAGRPIKVLNLFGYTGAATVACLASGAAVCHVDASKGMVGQAKRNIQLCGLADRQIRYIVDDCAKFVIREIRRGVRYDGIIMDPPSYGRGPSGEIWKLEDSIYDFLKLTSQVVSDHPLFFTVNSYTTGLAPSTMGYMLSEIFGSKEKVSCDEIGLTVSSTGLELPCGSTAMYINED